MLAILNSLNAHNFPIFQPILMIIVLKFMVPRALSDKFILIIKVAVPLKSLYRQVVSDVPVSCKPNRDKNQ